jgi:hypothetical protein
MNKLAPIVLFVYNRPEHTKQTVEALQKNELAIESDLIIYSDASKNIGDKAKTDEVRKYIKSINGFKKVTVIKREKNWGLAASIIDGVTKIVNAYGKVIVLEDDLVTSPYFLKFMNDALEFYKNEDKVWHISGWNYPIEIDGLNDVFLWKVMNCWGWATWAENWNFFEKDADRLMKNFSEDEIKEFNLNGVEDFFEQVKANMESRTNTWAVFWYATIFKKNALCVNPLISYVNNIGFDASGVHCGNNTSHKIDKLNRKSDVIFENAIFENTNSLRLIQEFYRNQKKTIFRRIINKIKLIKRV